MTDTPPRSPLVPDGWTWLDIRSEYSKQLGPLYVSTDPLGLGFVAEARHSNTNGVVHGGAMATLADIGLFLIASEGEDMMNGATLSLNLNFLRPAPLESFIYCSGRIVRQGSSIIFVEGALWAGTDELQTFNGVIKRFR